MRLLRAVGMVAVVLIGAYLAIIGPVADGFAQDKVITVPKRVEGAPFAVEDNSDLFGKAYRWYIDGETEWAADSLKKLIQMSGFEFDPRHYYIVVANFTPQISPIGLFHEGSAFLDRRIYGLTDARLFYVFISRTPQAPSFLSVVLTRKDSPFEANLLNFISLFPPVLQPLAQPGPATTWIDVREFEIPEKFQKFSDISVIVKEDLAAEDNLAAAIFDNTALERWSYGIATAVTTVDDVEFEIGNDGRIIVRPKPKGDLATFGVINYHFQPVDTKAPTLASSFHLLGGLRLAPEIEPLVGIGFGFPVAVIELHLFGGASVQFARELKEGFSVGQQVAEGVDPFGLDVRVRGRVGLEVKFP